MPTPLRSVLASRSFRRASVSVLALLVAAAPGTQAMAANYTVSNQAELVSAINSANADGSATSTITLASSFSILGSSLPQVTKNLTIDMGTNVLTSTGATTLNVAAGAELTVDGALRVTGTAGNLTTGGRLLKAGEGDLVITGGPSSYTWYLAADAGNVVIKDGANVSFDGITAPAMSQSTGRSTVTVTGVGTVVTERGATHLGTAEGATLNIEGGAHYLTTTGMRVGYFTGSTGTVNVSGDGSILQGPINVSWGLGVINVTDRGHVDSSSASIGGAGPVDLGGRGRFLVSGEGSRWDNSGTFTFLRGSLDVLDGGVVQTSIMRMGTMNALSTQDSSIRVSGAGSELIVTSTAANAFQIGGGNGTKEGVITIANGGKVTVAAGAGTINMANTATTRAVLNIGGAEGEAATGAGGLSAAMLQFGPGTSVVNFNHTDASYGFDVNLNGNATLNQVGSGKTVLTADQTAFTGQTNVLAGTLAVNGILGGTMDVFGGRLQGTGTVGTTVNHAGGTIAPGNSIGTLTIDGDYTSNGGGLEMEATLGDDNSPTDLLVITGNALLGSGATTVSVLNLGGLGAPTTNGIKIVDVEGPQSDAGVFVLGAPAIGGAYRYELFQNDVDTGLDGDWYLRNSGELAPTAPTLENYPVALLGMIELPTLRQRVGQGEAAEQGLVTRIEGSEGHYEAGSSTAEAAYDSSMFLAQIGLAGRLLDTSDGSLTAGITAQYSRHYADVFSAYGDGSNSTEAFGLGASLTWRGSDGTYVDLQGQLAGFSSDLNAAGYSLVQGNGGAGFALGVEVGHAFALDDTWGLTPQAQLNYASVDFDAFTDRFGSEVSLRKGASLEGRLGLSIDYANAWQDGDGRQAKTALYGITNLTYEFLDEATVAVSGTELDFVGQKLAGELGLGGTLEWNDGAYALHGELLGSSTFQGSHAVKGTVGLTGKF
jgi:fibronectin-binding autotransporter adhesin